MKYFWISLGIFPILLILAGYIFPSNFFATQELLQEYVESFGVFGPLVFIALQVLQVIFSPISHYTISIAGGTLFGIGYGALYNWIGRVFGTIGAYYIGKYLGRRLLKRLVKKETREKFEKMFQKSPILLFLAYFLPVFPDDELTYLAGIANMNYKIFIQIALLGHVSGSLALAYVGNGIKSIGEPMFIGLSLVTLVGGVLLLCFVRNAEKQPL